MSYTRVWDPDTPIGSDDADLIDDFIRMKLVDIQERFGTVMGSDGDMINDPIIAYGMTDLKALITALQTAVVPVSKINLPAHVSDGSGGSPPSPLDTSSEGSGWYLVTLSVVSTGTGVSFIQIRYAGSLTLKEESAVSDFPGGGNGSMTAMIRVTDGATGITFAIGGTSLTWNIAYKWIGPLT